jgi:CheY-like chemotaxis protein
VSSSSRILIIDDNTSLGQNLREVLEGTPELDVDVRLAGDGNQGLARAKARGLRRRRRRRQAA